MQPAALIFDLDGTLLDSAPDIHAVSNAVLEQYGYAPLSFDQVRSFIGHGVPHLVDCLIKASGADPKDGLAERMIPDFNRIYEEAVTLTVPFPGVHAALETLRAAGHPLAICTNKPMGPARSTLGNFGLTPLFDTVIGGDSLPTRKPDPAPLRQALADLGGGPALYIGDSEVDAETAQRAALPFVLFTEGYRKTPVETLPHARAFSDFAVLPGIVAGWPWDAR
ncbi:phosphoglycolate phosphatase [Paenirhodobacter populi]|uniref:Phosphoglycolate phosphatase n=1 Tax=Paenirhodobacter populi TaxID=2306993 RepID=A0A443JA95_9RHOB|nr:phosphoglycolate phosphatase [Sinirhodobacter populi]RWR17394.1 phosphoglycolate phosphatase [Sinirhodobacter populi]